ncbi:MAG: hypothetical protein BWY95_00425 [Bacteroidetes bacterium ADurb.BinA104]|nr:MAG: hypothetical protein BWY95_00425 [Bacteroidetes bacterium ADurb.BinA104]
MSSGIVHVSINVVGYYLQNTGCGSCISRQTIPIQHSDVILQRSIYGADYSAVELEFHAGQIAKHDIAGNGCLDCQIRINQSANPCRIILTKPGVADSCIGSLGVDNPGKGIGICTQYGRYGSFSSPLVFGKGHDLDGVIVQVIGIHCPIKAIWL